MPDEGLLDKPKDLAKTAKKSAADTLVRELKRKATNRALALVFLGWLLGQGSRR